MDLTEESELFPNTILIKPKTLTVFTQNNMDKSPRTAGNQGKADVTNIID